MRVRDVWTDGRAVAATIALVAALAIVSFAWIYGAGLTYEEAGPIRSEGEAAAAASGLVPVLLGLALTASVPLRFFRRGTVVASLLAVVFGTNLFHYATYDSVFSHAYSFFLVAARPRPG